MDVAIKSEGLFTDVGRFLKVAALERWLYPEEIFLLLSIDSSLFGFSHTTIPMIGQPQNGDILFFMDYTHKSESDMIKALKSDKIEWAKKSNTDRIQESYLKIKVNGTEVINGCYCKAAPNHTSTYKTFMRRIYNLLSAVPAVQGAGAVPQRFSHYRECSSGERLDAKRYVLDPIVVECWNYCCSSGRLSGAGVSRLRAQSSSGSLASGMSSMPPAPPMIRGVSSPSQQNHYYTHTGYQPVQQQQTFNSVSAGTALLNSTPGNGWFNGGQQQQQLQQQQQYYDNIGFYGNGDSTCSQQHFIPPSQPNQLTQQQRLQPVHNAAFSQSQSTHMTSMCHPNSSFSDTDDTALSADALDDRMMEEFLSEAVLGDDPHIWACLSEDEGEMSTRADSRAVIVDFSPSSCEIAAQSLDGSAVGPKVLVCLSSDLPRHAIGPFYITFASTRNGDNIRTAAERITPSVLRTRAPLLNNCDAFSCRLSVSDAMNCALTPESEELFEFTASKQGLAAPEQKKLKRPLSNGHLKPKMGLLDLTKCANNDTAPMVVDTTSVAQGEVGGDPSPASSEDSSAADKENKIRIVEKLGYMRSALQHEDFEHRATSRDSEHQSAEGEEEGWLDDNQLSSLSHAELESLMDRYITSVVQQMVQLAALDDDLKAEIDSLDVNGFSLLHYCCLYNLKSLIPVLLDKGADINGLTNTGTTALHLAAAAGHSTVVHVLVDCDIDVKALDANRMLASEAAYQAGHMDIYEYLLKREDASNCNYLQSPFLQDTPRSPSRVSSRLSFDHTATSSSASSADSSFVAATQNIDHVDNSDSSSSALSSKLLHEAFASLSLTDKCALSLSIGQLSSSGIVPSTPPATFPQSGSVSSSAQKLTLQSNYNSAVNTPRLAGIDSEPEMFESSGGVGVVGVTRIARVSSMEEDMSEMHSVLSESDKESLDVAMSMMGQTELNQVEDEVRKIQNNVRGWLLRKNYTNLRDAAKVLQVAWREKKKVATPSSNTYSYIMQHEHGRVRSRSQHPQQGMMISTEGVENSSADFRSGFCDTPTVRSIEAGAVFFGGAEESGDGLRQRELQAAAATLQAATRAMIARKRSFSTVRRQTMASLVIQKSLVKWWVLNKTGSGGSPTENPPAATSNEGGASSSN